MNNLSLPQTIDHLQLISVHHGTASTDDRGGSTITVGYFKDYSAAKQAVKGKAFYGSDGEVMSKFLYTDGVQLYDVKHLGGFTDGEAAYRERLIAGIKSKLSPEELSLLNLPQ